VSECEKAFNRQDATSCIFEAFNWFAALLENECKDLLVSGEMSGFPIRGSLDTVLLEIT
jgi:hypothetical protein